ncbi:MAG: glycosyltransferase family 2 protein [Candidatus Magasanikbacteria bacterium]|jgi:glycosyltransferase involved in cell wall biosynthesis|nr:glycosyltransferase family 2 protein [Candidatus Scalindua sp.]MBT6335007.1 glycosyltransferase family 2 protein [Candidatus Magasanikbacteria bacterium]
MKQESGLKISFVIPVFNEQDSVSELHIEIVNVMKNLDFQYEVIFIDDGSTDNTFENLKKLANIKIIKFRKNFGQTASMDAGIKASSGEYVVTMDGDGQNDPADIPKLIEKMESENLDVVAGWRKNRKDPLTKKLSSRAAALVRKSLINDGIHDSGCTLKIHKRECFKHIDLTGEMHRFIPAVLKIKGFRVGELEVNHRPRTKGSTKYTWTRGVKGILDMISVWFWKKYANRPLHLFGGVGVIIIAISIVSGLVAIYQKIFIGIDLSDTILTDLSMFGFLISIQFLVFGLLADIMSKSYFASTNDKTYDISEIIENK